MFKLPKIFTFADKKLPKPKLNQETGQTGTGVMAKGRPVSVISDDLAASKGTAVYRQMSYDAEVKNGLRILVGSLLTKGWEVTPDDESDTAGKEQAEFIETAINGMRGSFDDFIYELVHSSLTFGTAVAEKNFKLSDDGKIGLDSIKCKPADEYMFELDEFNNILSLWLNVSGRRLVLDINKFIVFANDAVEGQPRGTSILRAAYKWYWLKSEMTKAWSFYLDKYGIPTARGKYERNTPKEEQDAMLSVLNNIQRETCITFPNDWEVDLMTANQVISGGGFKEIIDYCDTQITKCILGQTLSTSEGGRVGSMALGNVHADTLSGIISNLRRRVEEMVDEAIIRPLIDYNYPTPVYPNFQLPLEGKDTAVLADVIFKLISCEAVNPDETWIREYLGLPAREEVAEVTPALPTPPEPTQQTEQIPQSNI